MPKNLSRLFPFGLSLVLIWALSGCVEGGKVLRAKDHGQTIELRTGAGLDIILSGNPATGYRWEIAKVNARILGLQGEVDFQRTSEVLGTSGDFILHFEALNPGRTDLLLIYQRPFEVDREPGNIFEITVIVTS